MQKLNMKSPDLTARNIEQMAELFPQLVTETLGEDGKLKKAIDFELLKQELSDVLVEGDKERYQLTWPGKKEAILNANTPIDKTLRPVKEDSVNWDTTENLYIEGDNLEVLKLLQESYLGKVKCIYIDPPYNTGNDFVYRDDYSESVEEYVKESGQITEDKEKLFKNTDTNGRFHSDWLNMIYPRLRIARDLLVDDGVIFISIDDNEIENLKKICNEVFGEQNAIGTVVQNKQNAKNDTTDLQRNHEFILIYRKKTRYDGGTKILPTIIKRVYKTRDVFEEDGHYFYINDSITTRGEGGTLSTRPNLGYTVYFNPITNEKIAICDYDISKAKTAVQYEDLYITREDLISMGYVAIRPPKVRGQLGVWTWALEKFNSEKRNIIITGKPGSYSVKKRTFVRPENVSKVDGKLTYIDSDNTNARSIWDYSTNNGTIALNDTMGNSNVFDNAKNLEMLIECIRLVPDDELIVLDFFSGSATTAHAVMQLNAEDGGNRKYIMVQVPEQTPESSEAHKAGYSTICEIGKERIRRAAKKIQTETGADIDYGFRVYRTDSSNMKDIYYTPDKLGQGDLLDLTDNIKEDRTGEDLLIQVMLEKGLPLSLPMESKAIDGCTIHYVAGNSLIACFDTDIPSSLLQRIAQEDKPLRFVCRDASFADDSARINVEEIFKLFSPTTDIQVL